MGYDEAATAKQPTGGPKTIAATRVPPFPHDLMKTAEAKMSDTQPAQNEHVEHTPNPPQDKPLGSDFLSSSPTPPVTTPQPKSPPTQKDPCTKGGTSSTSGRNRQ
ncbi:hypothetical protein V6N13_048727 [Hibiscus sabdariffa]